MTRTLPALALAAALAAPLAHARMVSGVRLPDRIEVNDHPLELNGAARQKVFLFELYALGLYLEQRTADPQEAIASEQVKQLRLKVLRSLPKDQVAHALRKGFERSAEPEALARLEPKLQKLLSQLRDVKKQDELRLTYLPGIGTAVQEGSRTRAIIEGKEFADALFSIWLGPRTDMPKLRRALLGG